MNKKTNEQIIEENKVCGEILKLIDIDIIRLKCHKNDGPIKWDENGNHIDERKTAEEMKKEIRSIIREYINDLAKKVDKLGGFDKNEKSN